MTPIFLQKGENSNYFRIDGVNLYPTDMKNIQRDKQRRTT